MGKQRKARKQENLGKGKVTPVQVAFIVDRYLSDNSYSETRSVFRNEASCLISRSPVQEAPKGLLTLGSMLDEYIHLKEQKVILDQENARLEQEKLRVNNLLLGMQNVMNAYNSAGTPLRPPPTTQISGAAAKSMVMTSPLDPSVGSPAGYSVYNTPIATSVSMPSTSSMEVTNFLTPLTSLGSANKRKCPKAPDECMAAKKPCRVTPQELPNKAVRQANKAGSNCLPNGGLVNGPRIAKSLFTPPSTSPPTTPSDPTTPPQTSCSQSGKSISPLENYSSTTSAENSASQEVASSDSFTISLDVFTVSPSKQITSLSMGSRNHCISFKSPAKTDSKSLSRGDHVKGRLDFDGSDVPTTSENPMADGSSTSKSMKDMEVFDIDSMNLYDFGADFSISELLVDFDFCEGIDLSCNPAFNSSVVSTPESSHESMDGNVATTRVLSEFSSTMTEILSEKDMNLKGQDMLTSIKSTTKSIRISSPAKGCRRSAMDQENLCMPN